MPDISRLVIEIDSKGVVTATGNLENFTKASGKAGKETDGLAQKFGAFQLIIDKLPGPMKSVVAGLAGMVSPATAVASAFLEIGEAAVQYAKESVDAFAKFEMIKTNLEVVSTSAGEASATFTELQRMAGRTPFNVDQLAEAATMLRQTGISAYDLIPTLEMLGNVSGGSSEKFSRISMNFAQIQSTMKATAMDIRQFAMAGVPIYDMLERMGVTGTATADDITEAFRRMTEAGGQFYGAMEKGAQTLTGMKTNLEGLKEQLKALQAEYSGLSDAAKWWTETQTQFYQKQNEVLLEQIELKKLADKKESGTATIADEYREAELQITRIKRLIEDTSQTPAGRGREYQNIAIASLEKQLQLQTDIIAKYQPQIDAINQMAEAQAEYNAMLGASDEGYRTLQTKIEEYYGKTTEGQKEAIQNEIEWWRAEQQRKRYQDVYAYDGGSLRSVGKVQVGITDEENNKIETIIQSLVDGLQKGATGAGRIRREFADWVEVLSKVTGYERAIIQDELQGLGAIQKYSAEVTNFTDLMNSMPNLYEALGLDETGTFETAADSLRSVLQEMTESGLWDGTESSFQTLLANLNNLDNRATESRSNKFVADRVEQLNDAGKSTYELTLKRLVTEEKITEEAAKQALEMQHQLDYITNGYDIMGEIAISIDDALRSIRSGNGGYGQYAGAAFAQAGMNSIQGSDAGNFAQWMAQGGWIVGLINMLVGAITNVLNSIEGTDEILNPITNSLMQMKDMFKAILLPGLVLSRIFTALGEVSNTLLNAFSFGLIDEMAKVYDSMVGTNDEREIEEERLRALNEQYSNLFSALKEQEEYYLQQRRHLNAEWSIDQFQKKSVNDMILSPHGAFSTSPEDYIIATKHPEALMGGGGGNVYVNVANNANVNVSAQENIKTDGTKIVNIFIDAVKREMINGGMDSAMDAMSARRGGRLVYT